MDWEGISKVAARWKRASICCVSTLGDSADLRELWFHSSSESLFLWYLVRRVAIFFLPSHSHVCLKSRRGDPDSACTTPPRTLSRFIFPSICLIWMFTETNDGIFTPHVVLGCFVFPASCQLSVVPVGWTIYAGVGLRYSNKIATLPSAQDGRPRCPS